MSKTPEHILAKIQLAKRNSDKSFYLRGENLREIPVEIFELEQLELLDLTSNNINAISHLILRLKNLSQLYLTDNKLTTIPDALTYLINLDVLDLNHNQLNDIPYSICNLKNLAFLNLFSNNLTKLPNSIHHMKKLKTLLWDANPIATPPIEVLNKGLYAIKEYFQQLEQGKDFLYEAKFLIIGEAGAGKTTLAKKIENLAYELRSDEKSTEGIDVIQWKFNMENGQPFRVNIWDFGGQEIYHATHQFFLTKRSLYALVADTRKEDTDFHYWLNVVELLSDNSPLLIIKNEKQDRHREIPENQLRGQFVNFKETLPTNLATNRGLPEILFKIRHFISTLPHVGSVLPKTWVRVREALENDSRNHISLDEYLRICEQNGFKEKKDKLQLSEYLHDLGVCLHFQEDTLLKKTLILKPQWGTDAVYRVLDNKTVIRNLGRFTKADLSEIWHEDMYSEMQDELVQLMLNFQLCYKIPNSRDTYIAPQLLTENQPEYEWNEADNLLLRYQYEFMPKGIMTRFIVMMHELISGQKYVWRSGVILENEDSKAEVVEYYGKREVRIRILGRYKRDMMTIITHNIDKIHNSYHRMKYRKLIPCNCKKCKGSQNPYFFDYERLRKRLIVYRYEIECDKSYEMVNIQSLIDDVFTEYRTDVKDHPKSQDVIININNIGRDVKDSLLIAGNDNKIKD